MSLRLERKKRAIQIIQGLIAPSREKKKKQEKTTRSVFFSFARSHVQHCRWRLQRSTLSQPDPPLTLDGVQICFTRDCCWSEEENNRQSHSTTTRPSIESSGGKTELAEKKTRVDEKKKRQSSAIFGAGIRMRLFRPATCSPTVPRRSYRLDRTFRNHRVSISM